MIKRNGVIAYLIALVLFVLALALRLAIAPAEAGLPFITFFPAVTLTAIICGIYPASFNIVVAIALAAYLFFPPFFSISFVLNYAIIWPSTIFCLEEMLVILVVEAVYNYYHQMTTIQQDLQIDAIAFETQESTIITDSTATILRVNSAFSIIYGYSAEEAIGKTPSLFKSDLHDAQFYVDMWDQIHRNNFWEGEIWDKRKNGEIFASWLQISAITAKDGSISHYVASSSDITEYKNVQRELQHYHEHLQELVEEQTEKLNDSNARIQAIVDTVADGIITMNAQGIIQTCNPAAEDIFGYTAAELIGKNINLLMPAPYASEHNRYLERYLATGEAHIIGSGRIVKGLRKNGSTFPLDLTVNKMQLGGDLFFTGAVRDISERMDTKEQLNFFFDLSVDMLCIASADGYFKRVNPAFSLTLGWTHEEFLSRPLLDFVHPDDQAATLAEITRQITKGERVLNFENRYLHKNGSWRVLSWVSVPHEDKLLFATARDVTASKEAEQKIHHLNNTLSLFKKTLDQSLDSISICNAESLRFTYVNEGGVRQVGYSLSELMQMTALDIKPNLSLEEFKQLALPLIEGTQPSLTYKTVHRHKDGHLIPVEVFTQYLQIENEAPCFLSMVHDITQRQENERAIMLAKTEAEQANAAKSSFLAIMSHEIRTPMNGVIGMIDVLSQTSLKGYQMEMVETIRESAFSLLSIIEDILDFSKIEANKLELDNSPTEIADLIEKVCMMLERFATQKNVELTLFTDPKIPATVLADSQRLRQIIVNLTNNAIKFSSNQDRQGLVSVEAVLVESQTEQVVVEIRVIDSGIGMSEETMAHLFTPFTQADASTTRRFGGTGLGLSIVHNLTHLMGGTISVQSTLGQGSTFTVNLPVVPIQNEIADTKMHSLVNGLFCLVIGGRQGIANYLIAYLSYAGAKIIQVPDLNAAREFLRTQESTSKMWVWLIDTRYTLIEPEEIFSISKQNIKVILIQHGRRRTPRWQTTNQIVELDGSILTRKAIYQAIAIAAGKMDINDIADPSGNTEMPLIAPQREEALQQKRLILVAEDNETNQQVIRHQLALLGYVADIANNGTHALNRWHSGDYALLLTDLNMPEMDGYQLSRTIRAEENNTAHLPIIALSANVFKDQALRCKEVGMDDCLGKPTQLADMKTMLEKWLPHSTQPPQLIPEPVDIIQKPESKKPMDENSLIALVGNNPLFINELLLKFQQEATKIATDLQTAYQARQPKEVAALAHKLKSAARSVGALELGELCAALEEAGKAENLEILAEILPRFVAEASIVNDYLNTLITDVTHENNFAHEKAQKLL